MENNKTPAERANEVLCHFRTKGSKNGIRRYQNKDGSLTPLGRIHYGIGEKRNERAAEKITKKLGKERSREIATERRREEAIERADFRRIHDEALREARAEGLTDRFAEARAASVAAERLESERAAREARRAAEAETPMSEEDRRRSVVDSARGDLTGRDRSSAARTAEARDFDDGTPRSEESSTGTAADRGSTETTTSTRSSRGSDRSTERTGESASTRTADREAEATRAREAEATRAREEAAAREAAFNKSISTMGKTKNTLEEGGKVAGKLAEVSDDYIRNKPKAKLDLSNMSNKELNDALDRYNLERRYNDAFAPSTVTKGEQTLNKFLHGAEVTMGVATTAVGLAIAIRKLINK